MTRPRARLFLAALAVLLLILPYCATAPKPETERPPEKKAFSGASSRIAGILREMSEVRKAQPPEGEANADAAASGQSALEQRLNKRAQILAKAVSREMGVDFETRVYQMFGAPEPIKDETVLLEAVDDKGNVSEVPVVVQTRQLRSLTDQAVAVKAMRLAGEEQLATEFYKEVPEPVQAETASAFRRVYEEARLLGASPSAALRTTARESRFGIATALLAAFGRVVSEVGIALILGGNIRGFTRTITTAITLETSQGHFPQAFALGIVLLALVLVLNLFIRTGSERSESV